MLTENDDLESLLTALRDANPVIRARAADALGGLHDKRAIKPLLEALRDAEWTVRSSATVALVCLGALVSVDDLVPFLQSDDSESRWRAVWILGATQDQHRRAVELLEAALNDKDSEVRYRAAHALANLAPDRAVERLIVMLSDEDSLVRWEAAGLLHDIGDGRAIEPLIQALTDPNSDVRFHAAMALGKIGDERALPALLRVWQHDAGETLTGHRVRDAAGEALQEIKKRRHSCCS